MTWARVSVVAALVVAVGGMAAALYGRVRHADALSDALATARAALSETDARLGLSELARQAAERHVVELGQIIETERARAERSRAEFTQRLADLQAAAAKAATGPELIDMVNDLLKPKVAL